MTNNTFEKIRTLRSGKEKRCQEYLAAVREFTCPMFNSDGSWNIELTEEAGRLDMQLATAFYCGSQEDIELANKLTRRAPIPEFDGKRFDIFQTSIACHHLVVFKDKLEQETITWCKNVIEEGCGQRPGMYAPDFQFHGYNDNMPAMAVKTLILGGEILDRKDFIDMGIWKLRRFVEMLGRYGLISEYNSPNYTPDTIHNLMTLAKFAANEEAKVLSEKIVRRIWQDLAGHWHPTGKCPAAPFSRAYAHDFNNYLSSMNCLAWFLFGPELSNISPLETMKPRPGIEAMHGNDPIEHCTRMAWYSLTDDSFLDDETAALFIEKNYPFEFIASTFQGDSGDSPLRKTTATTYMTEDYSLGSASFAFCGGEQTTSLYATGTSDNINPVIGCRYLVNEETPGQIKPHSWHRLTTGEAECMGHGTAITVQHKNSTLASYVPHRNLSEKDVTCLRLALVAPRSVGQFSGFVDANGLELAIDKEYPINHWYGATLGNALVGFYPLAYNACGLPEAKIILRRNEKYDYLEIINYDGPARQFTRKVLSEIMNGVAFEIASSDNWDSPKAFLQALTEASKFEDQYLFRTRRLRYYRQDLPDRPGSMLSLNYSTEFDGCAERIIDGKLAPEPMWLCSEIPQDSLPLTGDDSLLAEPGILWDDLTVHCIPNDSWKIHKNGN